MTTLNAAAADVLRPFTPNAVTDVTGFGLFGHAHEMAERSGVRVVIDRRARARRARSRLRAPACARAATRATASSRRSRPTVVAEEVLALGYDAQTAGGLLVSLPADKALSLAGGVSARATSSSRASASSRTAPASSVR